MPARFAASTLREHRRRGGGWVLGLLLVSSLKPAWAQTPPERPALSSSAANRAPSAPTGLQRLVLPLVTNGSPRDPVTAWIGDNALWLKVEDLVNGGMLEGKVPRERIRMIRDQAHVRLQELADLLEYRFNEAELSLVVDLRQETMTVNAVNLLQRPAAPSDRPAPVSAAYLNYSLVGASGTAPTLLTEWAASYRGHSLLAQWVRDGQGRSYRGPVSLSLNEPEQKRQWVLGDTQWPGTSLLPGLSLGGVSVRRFYDFEPGIVTTPTMGLRGFATTPSTVEIQVNGAVVSQRPIPAGPFELTGILAQAGSNEVVAIIRDAFGRETRLSGESLYGSPLLLQPGLSTFALAMGQQRVGGTGPAPAYGDTVVAGQFNVGLRPWLTVGAAAQAAPDHVAAGGEMTATGRWGEWSGQVAGTRTPEGSGVALALSYRLSTPQWSMQAATVRRQRRFAEIGAVDTGQERLLEQTEFSLGRRLGGVDWALRYSQRLTTAPGRSQRWSLAASRRWSSHLNTQLEWSRQTGAITETAVSLMASYSLDPEHSLTTIARREGGRWSGSADVTRTPQTAFRTGYRLSHSWAGDGRTRQSAVVTRDTRLAQLELQASHEAGRTQGAWRVSGAVVAVDDTVGLTPPVRDAVVLVQVPDAPQVPVRVEGREVGQTDERGRLLVPGLSSYSRQRVSIDTDALPLSYEVGTVEQRVSAPLRGAAVANFEVKVYRATMGRILDPEGKPFVNAVLILPDGRRVATGTAGDFVIEGAAPSGTARVERPGAQHSGCTVRFPAPASDRSAFVRMGALPCTP